MTEHEKTPETLGEKAQSTMTDMESSISSLQDQVKGKGKDNRITHRFKPGWLLTTIVIMVIVSAATYFSAIKFSNVSQNSKALQQRCVIANKQIEIVNAKFNQLVALFDAALQDPSEPPPSAEVLKLYEKFKAPIPLQDCNNQAVAP